MPFDLPRRQCLHVLGEFLYGALGAYLGYTGSVHN